MVAGKSSSEEAKIGGITPEVLILSGRCEASPPYMRLPTWRLGYCTTIRRCAVSTKTTTATTATMPIANAMMNSADSAPVRPSSRVWTSALGSAATMPAKMISEVPLPTPRAVICSPSHISSSVPPTRVTMVTKRKNRPGSCTTGPIDAVWLSRPTAMP